MYGIKELNTYFEQMHKNESPAEVIDDLQKAMIAMGNAIEQLAQAQAMQNVVETPKTEEVQEEVIEEKEL